MAILINLLFYHDDISHPIQFRNAYEVARRSDQI